jgi:N6-L-threonylcarbamoyladenine synthase
MKILSIETSCDETGISILEAKGGKKNPHFRVLANALNSQVKIHAPYGGVFPSLAKREHQKNLPILLEKVLEKAGLRTLGGSVAKWRPNRQAPIDLITVTSGPGLEPALWSGIVFAKELAKNWKAPLIPVNHMKGHIFSVFGKNKGTFRLPKIKFPILSLLVSGGHTELVLVKDWQNYKVIGETLDDAAGEAFDKVARLLGLPYPGGPEISKLAEKGRKSKRETRFSGTPQGDGPRTEQIFQQKNCDPEKLGLSFALPRPMLKSPNFDFSFSGLKTAVLYLVRDLQKQHLNILQNDKIKRAIALEFEKAVVETLAHKTKKAAEKHGIKTLIVAGGVAANKFLQKEMKKMIKQPRSKISTEKPCFSVLFPGKNLATDNSIMIAIAGYLKYLEKPEKRYRIKAEGGLRF